MKLKLKKATTSKIIRVFIQDSSSTTGAGLTGLVFNSASLTAYYSREGASSATAITLVTATAGTWVSGGFVELSSANMPGVYELHLPDAVLATGANAVHVLLKGATNMVQCPIEIELDAVDYQDAAGFGLSRIDGTITSRSAPATPQTIDQTTALPTNPTANTIGEALFLADTMRGRRGTAQGGTSTTITLDASASATDNIYTGFAIFLLGGTGGGVPGTGQYRTITGYVGSTKVATVDPAWTTTPDNTSTFIVLLQPEANVGLWRGSVPNALSGGSVDGNLTKVNGVAAGTVAAAAAPTNFSAMSINSSGQLDVIKLAGQTVVAASGVTFPSSVASPTNITAGVITTVTNLTNAPTAGDLTTTMKASVTAQVAAELAARGITSSWSSDVDAQATSAAVNAGVAAAQSTAGAADAATLKSRIPAALFSGITSLGNWLRLVVRKSGADATALAEINTGGGTFDNTTDSGEAIRDRGDVAWTTGSGQADGARTITITVNDGAAVLQNAQVRLTEGVNTHTDETDSSGHAVFNVDDATYTVAITKDGYTFGGASLVVSADASQTYSMTATVIPPATDPDTTNAYTTCRDIHGAPASGMIVNFRLVTPPGEVDAWEGRTKSATSDVNGLVQMTLPKSTAYQVRYRDGAWIDDTTGSDPTHEITQTISRQGT